MGESKTGNNFINGTSKNATSIKAKVRIALIDVAFYGIDVRSKKRVHSIPETIYFVRV